MEQRDFLGDEVHMMQNDLKALRQENILLKMKCERQDETIETQRNDLNRLRAAYEDRVAESAALQSILENAGQVISAGIARYLQRRDLKRDTRRVDRTHQESDDKPMFLKSTAITTAKKEGDDALDALARAAGIPGQ